MCSWSMVRRIYTNLESTIAYHASCGFTGDQLYPLVLEATLILEGVGFKVRSWVCNGQHQAEHSSRSMEF